MRPALPLQLGALLALAACGTPPDSHPAVPAAATLPTSTSMSASTSTSASTSMTATTSAPAIDRTRSPGPVPAPVPAPAPVTQAPHHSAPAVAGTGQARTAPRRVVLGDIDLTGVGYDRGSTTAPVVVIDLSDFGCPYCAEFTRTTYPEIEREYVRTGKVFFKYVPFVVGSFPHSSESTRAVECAGEQGLFWPMADHVYEAQRYVKGGGDPWPLLAGIGSVVGADTVRLARCYLDRHTDARTARANDVASALGVRVTPSFIVNERPIQGALPIAEFRRVIDAALLVATAR